MQKLTFAALVLSIAASGVVSAQCPNSCSSSAAMKVSLEDKNIVETAAAAGAFNTLLAAAKAAGLAGALSGPGPFTVFAPTDAAFAKLPKGTIPTLLKPENKGRLAAILKYHVVPGKVMAKDVVKVTGAKTLNGQRVSVKVSDAGVMIDGARVTKTDINCSNGVIHIIDSVILPSEKNIVEVAASAKSFGTLLTAAKAAGLAPALMGDGPFTVFAPTDAAFAKLPEGTIATLLKPENKERLASILKHHVVKGRVYSGDAIKAGKAPTLNGTTVAITADDSGVSVSGSKVVAADLNASNGVIHVVDTVILP